MNNTNLNELNSMYSTYPVCVSEYVIDGKRYVVHSHFVGSKDIDKVIGDIAFKHAIADTLHVA